MSSNNSLWTEVRLKELLTYIEPIIELDDQTEYTTITVKRRHGGLEAREKLLGSQIQTKKQYKLVPGAFIISRVQCWHQAYAIVPNAITQSMVASTNYDQFVISSEIDKRFFWWLSYSPKFTEIVRNCAFGVVIEKMVFNRKAWLEQNISLPPLEEQRRIVARIEELVAKIEEAKGLQRATNSDIRGTLLSEYSNLIQNVQQLPMRDVAPLKRRPVLIELDKEYHELGIRSFGKGTFHKPSMTGAALGTKRIFHIEENDLLFNIVFAWEGAIAVAKPTDYGRVGSHRFLTCIPKKDLATSSFLCFHFLTEEGLQQILDASPGSAGRNRTLGIESLANIQVPVPPLEKQLKFDVLQKNLNLVKQRHAEISAELNALLLSILDKAFKGEL